MLPPRPPPEIHGQLMAIMGSPDTPEGMRGGCKRIYGAEVSWELSVLLQFGPSSRAFCCMGPYSR